MKHFGDAFRKRKFIGERKKEEVKFKNKLTSIASDTSDHANIAL